MLGFIIVVKDGVVNSLNKFDNSEQLELAFIKECNEYGVDPVDVNFDDGYMQLEDGTSINMVWDI